MASWMRWFGAACITAASVGISVSYAQAPPPVVLTPAPVAPAPPVAVVPPAPVMAVPVVVPVPPAASAEASDIASCLCLRQSIDRLNADMTASQGTYDTSRNEVAALDAQLQSMRATLDVNNPQAVAQFRQLLEQRDAAFRRSSGTAMSDYSGVVERYNARVNEYNSRCSNRPRDPVLLGQVQATLACPAMP